VGGTYTQPLLFAIRGESAVRQFLFGTRAMQDALGSLPVTYASQEPCYTSQLPQLLNGFGFRQAVLKNTWALFGNPPAIDRSRVSWEGPDGSRVDTSPRYAFDGYNQFVLDLYPGQGFLDQATRGGLTRPVSFNLGDFIKSSATAGVPWFNEKQFLGSASPDLEFTTWDQYFRGAPSDDSAPWKVSYNDFEYRFPWGLLGGRVQKQTAEAERALLRAEKIASVASLAAGAPYPADDLSRAWKDLLLAQHHDAWVCAPTVFGGWVSTKMYADWVDTWTEEAKGLAAGVASTSLRAIADRLPRAPGQAMVVVCNPRPQDYSGTIDVDTVDMPKGSFPSQMGVVDASGRSVPASVKVLERYPDRSVRRARVSLVGSVPAFGYASFSLTPAKTAAVLKPQTSARFGNGQVVLESPYYTVRVSARGVESIRDKALAREILRAPVGLTGYFPRNGGQQSGKGTAVSVVADTGFSAAARVNGTIGGLPFVMDVTLPAERRVDMDVSVDFGSGVYIGALEGNAVEAWTRSDQKLAILFPLRMESPRVTADAPFDAYEPAKQDFQALGWVQMADSGQGASVTLINDRATAYLLEKAASGTTIRAVLAYGGPFEYALDKDAPLRGKASYRISLASGGGDSTSADAWETSARAWDRPAALVVPPRADTAAPSPSRSLLSIAPGGASLEAAYWEGGSLLLRLFNPSDTPAVTRLLLDGTLAALPIHEVRLDGTEVGAVSVEGSSVTVTVAPFGLKTLRLGPAAGEAGGGG